jgi:hypothetical protein
VRRLLRRLPAKDRHQLIFGRTILRCDRGARLAPCLSSTRKERWLGWWIKVSGLPIMYWHYMLGGYEWFPKHNMAFKEPHETMSV